jgi:hydrogenase large subunit
MKITKEIIERIEGEATLEIEWKKGKISFAKIKFLNFRGIENILSGRPFLDALAITPRVCGICSTSHVIASINAIEDCYQNAGYNIQLTKKAKSIREIVLNGEKIQNHLKWLYFNIYPEIIKLDSKNKKNAFAFNDNEWKKAQKIITKILKMTAIFSGQWPHASFCMVGGVTTDPTDGDILSALSYLDEIIEFCEKEIFGISLEEYTTYDSSIQIMANNSILSKVVNLLNKNGFASLGKSYDRFISLGESLFYEEASKSVGTSVASADKKFVSEDLTNSFFNEDGYTYSKSAIYKDKYFETGPLARMMIGKNPLIRDFHRRYKDATLTRIVARVSEISYLLLQNKKLLTNLDIKEHSCISPKVEFNSISSSGYGVVEAARGTLIHKLEIKNGFIKEYDIITPTVWNLGNGSVENPSIAQNAIIGVSDVDKADLIFKSFDVCSVCTTQ